MMLRFAASQFFFSLCFVIKKNPETGEILLKVKECWLPKHIQIDETPTTQQQFFVRSAKFRKYLQS